MGIGADEAWKMTISVPTTMATSTASSKAAEPSETDEPPESKASKTHKPPGHKTSSTIAPSSTACTAKPARPTPSGAICQKAGTINPGEWDMIRDTTATSVADCACQCLSDVYCALSDFTSSTNDCKLFLFSASMEQFVADPTSPSILSDAACFVKR